jgi:transposase
MESNPLFPAPEGMQIGQIQTNQNEVSIMVIATHPTSCCPLCRHLSSSIHSRYHRTVRDAPCGGCCVQLALCVRKIFTERLPELVHP